MIISKDKGFTPTDLQLMLKTDIEKTLSQIALLNPKGGTVSMSAYCQFLPIPQSADEDDENDFIPYTLVKLQTGEKDGSDPYVITVGLVICVCNYGLNREGHFDLMNVIQRLSARFAKDPYVGNFEVQPSFNFALQESDTYPYYYAGVILKFNAPTTIKEVSFLT